MPYIPDASDYTIIIFIHAFGSSTKPATFEQTNQTLDVTMKSFIKMKTETAVAIQSYDLSIEYHQ